MPNSFPRRLTMLVLLLSFLEPMMIQAGPNCNIPLNDFLGEYKCIANCLAQNHDSPDTFICDISADWMHHVGGGDAWYPATPPKGTGIHEYVAFTGQSPPCSENGHCHACNKDQVVGQKVCSVFVDPKDCSVQCPDSSGGPPTLVWMTIAMVLVGGSYYWRTKGSKKKSLSR